jgi:preprotein translocase subunit SecA
MLKRLVRMFGGDPNQKKLQELAEEAEYINSLEPQFEALSTEELSAKTNQFRLRLAKGESLDDILPEAFATVREVSKRTIGLRHYDVQLIGGISLHRGIVAEMKTGEGKTLVATLPLYLNALELNPDWVERARQKWGQDPEKWEFVPLEGVMVGLGVHLITVNDYLARRDARWKAPIYDLLGMKVGVLQMASRTEHGRKAFLVDLERDSPHEDQHQLELVDRKLAYDADITYGTNAEFGFDYLRDNMKMSLGERVQRGHYYAIIDEVDNVLIDEARTPLIISGPAAEATEWYVKMAQIVRGLRPEDYEISEKDRTVVLTEVGEVHVEEMLGMALRDPDRPEDVTPEQARLLGYLEQAMRAQFLYNRNKEYVVQGGKIVIVDTFTGRLMPGRRWSDGLHQAVEAKEGVKVESENVTYATVTIQNYFRMYDKLSGMTGTALTEAEEFDEIYKLGVLAIPMNLEYQAERDDSPLIALQATDEYNYKYTYYAHQDDPEQKPLYFKRKDYPDSIYRTEEAKLRAIVREILVYHVIGRPILVGTTSVELSERVSQRLRSEPVRRLVQALLIRDAWITKNNHAEDGRAIAALEPLNVPLDQLRPTDLRQMIKEMDLGTSINPDDDQNIERLLKILGLHPSHKERLSEIFKGGIPHQVLNARKHTEESQIIAGAGAFGAVTIATNMAGRGVDIKLGGELAEQVLISVNRVLRRAGFENAYEMTLDQRRDALLSLSTDDYGIYGAEIEFFLQSIRDMDAVKVLGGLHVIGSERHEARRIDNQLRGRAARQGDPGSSRFYLSLEDELMVRFGGQQMEGMLTRLKVDEGMPIENNLVSRVVESSQSRVEGANFDVRKHLLEYDDVLNTQRVAIYGQRNRIFVKDNLDEDVTEMLETEVLRRVPEALADEGGPWKLLSWLEQIQPSLPARDGIFPSYALKILLDDQPDSLSREQSQKRLLQFAADAIKAEEEHILQSVAESIEASEIRMQEQLDERLDALDAFMEGLELEDETTSRSPQQLSDELVQVVRLPLRLSNAQTRDLRDDPRALDEGLRDQIEKLMMGLTITRLVGAVQRVLKEDIGLSSIDISTADWDSLSNQVLSAVENTFANRFERFIGNGTPGHIAVDLEKSLNNLGKDTLNKSDLYNLLLVLPQGRRAGFDKKTHRRVWMRTTRITFIYSAAKLLDNRTSEEITQDVLTHLQAAQTAIRQVWGDSEINRLGDARLLDLDTISRAGLNNALGENVFKEIQSSPLNTLPESQRNRIADELGRQALTQIYRQLLLRVISELWVEYLTQMEALRVSIGLEAYAQRDPLVQYKNQAFEMFQGLLRDMRMSVVTRMFTFRPRDLSSVQSSVTDADEPILEAVAIPQAPVPQESKPSKKKRRRRRR